MVCIVTVTMLTFLRQEMRYNYELTVCSSITVAVVTGCEVSSSQIWYVQNLPLYTEKHAAE